MITPRKVEPDVEAKVLRLLWSDGHRSEIPFQTLRDRCPCARCRSSREAGRIALPMAMTTRLTAWRKVGNYALHFTWGDAHSEGIFAFDHLRSLCPCGACAASAGDSRGA